MKSDEVKTETDLIRELQAILDTPGNIHGTVRKGTLADDSPNHQSDSRPRLVFELHCCPAKFGNREMIAKLSLLDYRIIFKFSFSDCQCVSDICFS